MTSIPWRLFTQLHRIRPTARPLANIVCHQNLNANGSPFPPSALPLGSAVVSMQARRGFVEQNKPTPLTENISEELRDVMRNVPQSVVVVTTCSPTDPSHRRGITVSSFTAVTLHPHPVVSFCIRRPSRASNLLHTSSLFVAHILSSHQVAHAIAFSSPAASQFDGLSFYVDPNTKLPVLMGAVGAMHCKRERVIEIGDHEMWFGEVYKVEHGVGGVKGVKEEARPLVYHDRKYRSVGEQVFMGAFEDQTLDFGSWTHRAHVRMAWNYMRELGKEKAVPLIKTGIQKYNAANAHQIRSGYNETITSFYIYMVDKAVQADSESRMGSALATEDKEDFFAFLQRFPSLADRRLIYRYYSKEFVGSEKAKTEFVQPDLQPLPDRIDIDQIARFANDDGS